MRVEKGSEADLQAAVALEGPVALAVDGNHNAFRVSEDTYQGIIYMQVDGKSTALYPHTLICAQPYA